jgi:ABC-type phosphate transport system substrate-binding protein
MRRRILGLIIAFAFCATSQQGFSVVVNKDNPATGISKSQLRKMMMGETASWPGGAKVMVLLGPAGEGSRAAALKDICGMSESDYSHQSLQASFAGGAKVVKTLPSTAAVRQVVAISPGGVGIVEGTQAGPGLKILPIE